MSIIEIKKAGKLELQQDPFNVGQQIKVVVDAIVVDANIADIQSFCENLKGEGEWKELPEGHGLNSVWTGTKFIKKQPFASWTYDDVNDVWAAPITKPENTTFTVQHVNVDENGNETPYDTTVDTYWMTWNETDQRWEGLNRQDNNNYYWNPDNSTWNLIS